MTPGTWDYVLVMVFGLVTGAGELLSRYRDSPWDAVASRPGLVYLILNAVSGLFGLWLIYTLNLKFGWTDEQAIRWSRLLTAGFASLALFRSSLFVVRVGERDVPIGPAAALQAILASADRAVDRLQATARHNFVKDLLPTDFKYDKPRHTFFVTYCLGLMQNVSAEDQKQLRLQLDQLYSQTLDGRKKATLVCLQLVPFLGVELLELVVHELKRELPAGSDPPAPDPPDVERIIADDPEELETDTPPTSPPPPSGFRG